MRCFSEHQGLYSSTQPLSRIHKNCQWKPYTMERLFKMEILAIWSSACMSFWHISPREQQLNLARCCWPALRRELDIFGHQDYSSVMVTIYGFLLRISEPLSTKSTMNNSIFGYLDWIAIVLPPFPIPNSPGFLYCAYIHQLSLDWTSWPGYCPWYNLQIFRTSPLQNRWGVHYVSLSDYVWNNGESIYQSQSGCYKENNDRLRNFYDERLKPLPILIPNSPPGGNCCPRPPNKVCELQAAIMPPAYRKSSSKAKHDFIKDKANAFSSTPQYWFLVSDWIKRWPASLFSRRSAGIQSRLP